MKSVKRLTPYFLIALLLPLAGCPYWGHHDDRGENRGRVDQPQGPSHDHPDNGKHDGDGRHDDGNQHPDSNRDH